MTTDNQQQPDSSRRFVLKALAAAPAFGVVSANAKMSKAERELDARLKADKTKIFLREPEGEQKKELEAIADAIYAKIPSAIPEARKIPPKPKFYIFNDEKIMFQAEHTVDGKATAIVMSTEALRLLTHEERVVAIAHEIGHQLMDANPKLFATYSPPNPDAVSADMQARYVSQKGSKEKYAGYMQELCADEIAVRLTRAPAQLISALAKTQDNVRRSMRDDNQRALMAYSLNIMGHERPREEVKRKAIEASVAQARENSIKGLEEYIRLDPHPSLAVREEAANMVEQKLRTRGMTPVSTREGNSFGERERRRTASKEPARR